jgi:tetratricopeptide (TPR) repeat protein
MMRRFFLLILLLAGGAVVAQPVSTTRADEKLVDLMAIQRELLARAAEAEVQEDIEQIRPRLQDLVFEWEDYLRNYPEKPEGYVAYSMLLGNPLVDERTRAKALLLRANELDADQPIVKNQLGKYLAEEGLPLQALPYFLAAVELAPNEPLYHYQVGQLLGGARAEFLVSGEWTVESIDTAMQHAFAEAVRLDPDSLPYAYRYAESYYDLETPPWDEALAAWEALEARVESETEQQMMRLHQANVLLFQGKLDEAEAMLQEAFTGPLASQRERLVARLDRLRNPAPVAASTDETLTPEAAAETAPTASQPPFVVPEFRPVKIIDPVSVDSEAVMDLHESETDEPMPVAPPGPAENE